MTLDSPKTSSHKYLGKGLWAIIPDGYFKAENYDGYQYPGYKSSISVKYEDISFSRQKAKFSKRLLRRAKVKLLDFKEIAPSNHDSAFYTFILDQRNKVYKHILTIKDGERVKNVVGICFQGLGEEFNPKVKDIIQSIHFADEPKDEGFILAQQYLTGTEIYTRDGNNPTESEDEAWLEIGPYTGQTRSKNIKDLTTLLSDVTEGEENEMSVKEEALVNGTYFHASSEGNGKYAFAALLFDENNDGLYTLCHGNERSNIADCRKYFMTNYLRFEIE